MPDLPPPKKVVVLGSTGSIGESSLKVARDLPNRMTLVGLAAHSSVDSLAAQIHEFGIKQSCLYDPIGLDSLKSAVPSDVTLHTGEEGLIELATLPEADLVLIAIVGVAGLRPALAAIEAGKDIVASKEILVMAGEAGGLRPLGKKGSKSSGGLRTQRDFSMPRRPRFRRRISRLILTASGGPFPPTPRVEPVRRHRRGSSETPDVGDGAQDLDRFGNFVQQRSGDDRSPLAF